MRGAAHAMYLILITAVFVQQCESSEDLPENLRGSSGQKWLPANNGLYDETPSGEQDAMNEVSGTEKGLVSKFKKGVVAGGKAVAKVVVKTIKSGAWRMFLPGNNGIYDENPSGEQDAMKEVEPSGEQDAMNEVSGTEKGFLAKAANLVKKVVKKDQENYQKQKHHPKDWHKWLPGNNGFYDENPSDEQDAMKEEVSGTGKGLLSPAAHKIVDPAVHKMLGPGGIWKYDPEYQKHHHHHPHGQEDAMYDENPSDEQDAMNEVSGTEKGLLENFEKGVVKGVKEAAKIVTKVVKKDQENYQKQKHHPKDWHKWLPGNNGFYDENPSDEQDAMKEEVSGTGKGLLSPAAAAAAHKIVGPGGIWKYDPENQKHHHHHHPHGQEDAMYDENPSDEQDAMSEVVGNGK